MECAADENVSLPLSNKRVGQTTVTKFSLTISYRIFSNDNGALILKVRQPCSVLVSNPRPPQYKKQQLSLVSIATEPLMKAEQINFYINEKYQRRPGQTKNPLKYVKHCFATLPPPQE